MALTDGIIQNATTTGASAAGVPDWYSEYIRGIAGKGVELAGNAANSPVPQQSIAGFTPDQERAFAAIRANQGSWIPSVQRANGAFEQSAQVAQGAAGAANSAVAGPAANFTDNVSKYMSPYTSSVVNEIARLGNRNFDENVMPKINASMIGSGQFGSERNAGVLSRAGRDVQADITGQQASALEQGYSTAGNLFSQDANRQQAQQATQAQTALAGGQLAAGALTTTGTNIGSQGNQIAGLNAADATALQASGQQQQQLAQTGLDTDYNNLVGQQNFDWTNLNNLNSIVRGAQLPTTQTAVNNGPLTRTASASPLAQAGALYSGLAGS